MVRHPHALRDAAVPSAVTVGGTDYPIDSDGVVDCPESVADAIQAAWEAQYGVCLEAKTDGDTCGRELPCPYHTEGE
jgi:hypothetical protein